MHIIMSNYDVLGVVLQQFLFPVPISPFSDNSATWHGRGWGDLGGGHLCRLIQQVGWGWLGQGAGAAGPFSLHVISELLRMWKQKLLCLAEAWAWPCISSSGRQSSPRADPLTKPLFTSQTAMCTGVTGGQRRSQQVQDGARESAFLESSVCCAGSCTTLRIKRLEDFNICGPQNTL